MTARDESAIARKRGRTGANFEAELNMQHRVYEMQKCGYIWQHSPPFVFFKKEWHPKAGGGPIDRTGHVCVEIFDNGGPREQWNGASMIDVFPRKTRYVIPVAFDAKVLGEGHATYQHDKDSVHQLMQLRDAANAGVCAFLLIHALELDCVFAVSIEKHFTDLVSRKGVQLWERERSGTDWIVYPRVPNISRSQAVGGWDWIPMLSYLPSHIAPGTRRLDAMLSDSLKRIKKTI